MVGLIANVVMLPLDPGVTLFSNRYLVSGSGSVPPSG
jgi:hypothetical protein